MIEITMENGKTIRIELDAEAAPITVENFTKLVKQGFMTADVPPHIPGFMIQGGCPEGTGMGGPGYGIKGEFAANGVENPIRHTRGVISMARSQMPNSAGSQFFTMAWPTRRIWTAVTPLSAMWWKAWTLSTRSRPSPRISATSPKRPL